MLRKYFDNNFTEMFLELSSNNHMNCVSIIGLNGCNINRKAYFSSKPWLYIQMSVVAHGHLVFLVFAAINCFILVLKEKSLQ